MLKKIVIVLLTFLIFNNLAFTDEISITIKGMDDGIKTNKQQDYQEAVMNAKLQAIEQAGAEISSITMMQNFKVKYDAVESKSEGVLLPGFQIMDIGYQTDGTYLIILTGKIKSNDEENEKPSEIYNKAMLYQKKEQYAEAIELFEILIERHEGSEYAIKAFDQIEVIKKEFNTLFKYEVIGQIRLKCKTNENKMLEVNQSMKKFIKYGIDKKPHVVLLEITNESTIKIIDISVMIFLDGRFIDKWECKRHRKKTYVNKIYGSFYDKISDSSFDFSFGKSFSDEDKSNNYNINDYRLMIACGVKDE